MKHITFTPSLLTSLVLAGCGALHSTTYIQPNDAFVLGENAHGKFSVKMMV